MAYRFTVNDERVEVDGDGMRPLAHVLRDDLGLAGHQGRAASRAAAAPARSSSTAGRSCRACIRSRSQTASHVRTVEGLAAQDGALSPCRTRCSDAGGVQCGISTPGVLMSLTALLEPNASPDRAGDTRRPERQHLPLHRLSEDRGGGAVAVGGERPVSGVIGARVPRADGRAKVTGSATYCLDRELPRMLHARLLRSPMAPADASPVSTRRARRRCRGSARWSPPQSPAALSGMFIKDQPLLADERRPLHRRAGRRRGGGHVEAAAGGARGDRARDRAAAGRHRARGGDRRGCAAGPRRLAGLWRRDRGRARRQRLWEAELERGDVAAAFARDDVVVVEDEFRVPRQHQSYIEPRCAVAQLRRARYVDPYLDAVPGARARPDRRGARRAALRGRGSSPTRRRRLRRQARRRARTLRRAPRANAPAPGEARLHPRRGIRRLRRCARTRSSGCAPP